MKILAADNEVGSLAEVDDRSLSEILKFVKQNDDFGLDGTGFDDAMLANLVFITRSKHEIPDELAAAEWAGAGMPEHLSEKEAVIELRLRFKSGKARDAFVQKIGAIPTKRVGEIVTAPWPPRGKHDLKSIKLV